MRVTLDMFLLVYAVITFAFFSSGASQSCAYRHKKLTLPLSSVSVNHLRKKRIRIGCALLVFRRRRANMLRLYRSNYEWYRIAVGIGRRSVVNMGERPQGDLVLCPVILVALLRPYVVRLLGGPPASGRITHCTLPVRPSVRRSQRRL